jgi:hypothetical protein
MTYATTAPPFAENDKVVILPAYQRPGDAGRVFTVTKLLPKNVRLTGPDGAIVDAPRSAITHASPAEVAAAEAVAATVLPHLIPGQLATADTSKHRKLQAGLYVVLRQINNQFVSVVKLGGEEGRTWPKLPREWFTPVDPSRIRFDA